MRTVFDCWPMKNSDISNSRFNNEQESREKDESREREIQRTKQQTWQNRREVKEQAHREQNIVQTKMRKLVEIMTKARSARKKNTAISVNFMGLRSSLAGSLFSPYFDVASNIVAVVSSLNSLFATL